VTEFSSAGTGKLDRGGAGRVSAEIAYASRQSVAGNGRVHSLLQTLILRCLTCVIFC